MHPRTAHTQIKTLRIFSCIPPPPPPPVQLYTPSSSFSSSSPPTRAFGFYLSCVQAQASVKRTEETGAASALSSGWENSCLHYVEHWASWPPFRVSDPQQMDGEAGDDIQHLGSSTTPSRDLVPLMGEKIKNPYLQWKMWMDHFQRRASSFQRLLSQHQQRSSPKMNFELRVSLTLPQLNLMRGSCCAAICWLQKILHATCHSFFSPCLKSWCKLPQFLVMFAIFPQLWIAFNF